ncbi:hypothetical protein ACFQI3_02045 [Hansschlegelia quercus]|uniref:Uncharacterized protein n=1 Tax=Hansschlegelia quercus TaxID=2528245 RepID=A0A4Q9GK38_9HYPH|nr:hypothetical protein [Hansschlegelia quercus]TBN54719.1 hypothetical protein EYR15_00685 [Hansschlegelia quercus]
MHINALVSALRNRVPWSVARRLLTVSGASASQGWERTETRLTADNVDRDTKDALIEALREHILGGEKLVRFYRLPRAEMNSIRAAVAALTVEPSALSRAYPGILSAAALVGGGLGHRLAAVERREDGTAVIYHSIRIVEVRELIAPERLPQAAREALEGFDEVVGFKEMKLQAYDVIWVPNEGNFVEVRVDFPKGSRRDISESAHAQVTRAFGASIEHRFYYDAINLFPLINAMYVSEDEGDVVELAFSTTTGSLKHEKMRRSRQSLRRELYHTSGKAGLQTPIEPYLLSLRWQRRPGRDNAAQPELELHSTSYEVASETARLYEMTVRNCLYLDDYLFVRNRAKHHLRAIARAVA